MALEGEMRRAGSAAREAERTAAPGVEALARFGFAAKGVVYILVGVLAARAALGDGGAEGSSGALQSLRDEPFGQALLWLIGLGLLGYVVWRGYSAVRNPEGLGTGERVFHGITAVIYGALALEALRLGAGSGGGGDSSHWTASLMSAPFGQVLVGLAGVAIAAYGLQQVWSAWTVDLDEQLDLSRLGAGARRWAVRAGRGGLAARGVVLTILGYMFVRAAIEADPSDARGVEGVLDSMREHGWLLGLIALGLIAYGVYNLVRARYRRIHPA